MTNEVNNNEKTQLKDIKSIDELDFDKIELKRGETPPDIKGKCLQLCKDYLSGNWCQQTVDTIEVNRITGGLMNQLYYCGICQPNSDEKVPQEVAVRLYGENIFDPEDKAHIRDVVISLIFYENKLGPKLYGLFEGGQIQKFYKHRQFKEEEQKNPKIVEQIFKTLAKIHSLDVPIRKNGNWMYEITVKMFEVVQKIPLNDYIKEFNCKTLSEDKLKTEINWIKDIIESANSPVVFTHNDYRSSNLLITEPNDELIVCDYDLTQYGYRGSDFVSLVREWGKPQFDMKPFEDFPPDSELIPLIKIYIKECERIYGKSYSQSVVNSVDHILKEVKIFFMFTCLFFTVFILSNDQNNNGLPIPKQLMMEMSELNFKNYFTVKKILKEQNIIIVLNRVQ